MIPLCPPSEKGEECMEALKRGMQAKGDQGEFSAINQKKDDS